MSPISSLFRSAALEQASVRSYGTVLLARPVTHTMLTLLFTAFALCVIAFFMCFSFTRKAKISGVLLPSQGVVRLVAMQSGVIVERRVIEGQPVKAGDVLFVIVSERASATQGNAEQNMSALLQGRRSSLVNETDNLRLQAAQRQDAIQIRLGDLSTEQRRVDEQVALQQRRISLAEVSLKRFVDLQGANFVSAVQVQDKQAELLDQQQRLSDLQRTHGALGRDMSAARADLRDLQVQARRDQEAGFRNVSVAEQELTEIEARREILVRAPRDGTIAAINAEPGQAVASNQSIASILPAGSELEAEVYAPSRAAGFLQPGMKVLVRYQAYSYQKFGQASGTVREISRTAMRPEEMMLPGATLGAGTTGEPLYRVRVKLERQSVIAYGSDVPLRSGALLDASILLETRRLYEWVLEPLYTITGRV